MSHVRGVLEEWARIENRARHMFELLELLESDEDDATREDLGCEFKSFEKELAGLEVTNFLSGEHDGSEAYVYVKPGAGGLESQDWASMVFRMYIRFFDEEKWKYTVLEYQDDCDAGIKSGLILAKRPYAFGYLKGEKGVHRLVRISPFDANHKRHTSFCAVDVFPEFKEDVDIDLKESDIKMDTFRASGAGGQYVNKTDSAVRLTHLPSGIIVTCQCERSQHSNRATATKILKARLFLYYKKLQDEAIDKVRGAKSDNSFGHQIRNYTLHPYSMVKDVRTGVETGNANGVLNGDLQPYLDAFIRYQAEIDQATLSGTSGTVEQD